MPYVVAIVVAFGLALARLRRPFVGIGHALLWGLLFGGVAFAGGMAYLHFIHPWPRPRNDSDWSGLLVPLICIFYIPGISVFLGLILGVVHAFRRERSAKASSRDALEL